MDNNLNKGETRMKVIIVTAAFGLFMADHNAIADSSTNSAKDEIVEAITNICDKPSNAGKYWDVAVSGAGEAAIKLKLAKAGLTGETKFSKKEWTNIQNTIENSANYRDCAKELTPQFLAHFKPLAPSQPSEGSKGKKRILAGLSWTTVENGIEMTLKECRRKSTNLNCVFTMQAIDKDSRIAVYNGTYIYDQGGNKFEIVNTKIANQGSKAELIRKVDTPMELRFGNLYDSSTLVSKVSIRTQVNGHNR